MKYLAHLLPRVDKLWVDENTCVDITGRYSELANSLVEFIAKVNPNVLIEHELNGGTYGKVLEGFEKPDGIWAKIEVDNLPDGTTTRWVSPRIGWNHVDVHGRKWPAVLLECSLVSVPRFLVGQKEMVETKMSESTYSSLLNTTELTPLSESSDVTATEGKMTREEIEALVRELLAAALAETTKMADPAVEIEIEDPDLEAVMGEVVEDISTITDVDAYVTGLSPENAKSHLASLIRKAQLAADETLMSQVKSELATRKIPVEKAGDFFKMAKSDLKTYQSAMSAIPTSSVRTVPTVAAPLTRNANADNPAAAAVEAQKRGEGKFTDLLAKYNKAGS